MPATSELLPNNRVVVCRYTEPLDMDEVVILFGALERELFDHAAKPIHIIADCSQITQLPSNAIGSSAKLLGKAHPMSGVVIVIVSNPFLKSIVDVVGKLSRSKPITGCHNVAEALQEVDRILAAEDLLSGTARPERKL